MVIEPSGTRLIISLECGDSVTILSKEGSKLTLDSKAGVLRGVSSNKTGEGVSYMNIKKGRISTQSKDVVDQKEDTTQITFDLTVED